MATHVYPVNALSDSSMIQGIRAKDPHAMMALFDAYSTLIYSTALRVLKDPGAADDVMQEVFLQLWCGTGAYDPGQGQLACWLSVLARNRALSILRRTRHFDPLDGLPNTSNENPDQHLDNASKMASVGRAMAALPAAQADYVNMAFLLELTHTQIAEATGVPLGTVKTRIRKAIGNIRQCVTVEAAASLSIRIQRQSPIASV